MCYSFLNNKEVSNNRVIFDVLLLGLKLVECTTQWLFLMRGIVNSLELLVESKRSENQHPFIVLTVPLTEV